MTTAYTPGDIIPQFDVADRLKKALSVADVPVGEMAEYIGITRETLSRYLNGRTPAPIAVVRLISVRTRVSLTWLQTGKAPARPQGPGGGPECPQEGLSGILGNRVEAAKRAS